MTKINGNGNLPPNWGGGVNGFPGFVANGAPKQWPTFPGGMRFRNECGESVQHIIKGLTSAVQLLQDGGCPTQPNDCQPKPNSWCFPQMNWAPVVWPNSYFNPPPAPYPQPRPVPNPPQKQSDTISFFCR